MDNCQVMKTLNLVISWLAIFAVSYALLSILGWMPVEVKELNAATLALFAKTDNTAGPISAQNPVVIGEPNTDNNAPEAGIEPLRLSISKIGVDAPVENPRSRDTAVLDEALLKGVVRFPGSGLLESNSNMFIFGHSTNWATVQHQAYKALNRLGELQLGDEIELLSTEKVYVYKVTNMSLVDKDEALVKFETGKKKLTLSTCDTFGQKSDRFVVEAIFVGSRSLADR